MHPFLIPEHPFASKHERSTLRGENYCLRQPRCSLTLGIGRFRHGFAKLVSKHQVVVTRHIIDDLGRGGIWELRIVALGVIDLRMIRSCYNPYLDSLLKPWFAGSEPTVGSIAVMPLYGITYVIAEHSYTRHSGYILFKSALFDRQRRVSGSPPLSIYEYRRIYLPEGFCHKVHGLDIMNCHKVETETVDMILLSPILHRVDDKVPHLLTVRCGLVSAARSIAVRSIRTMTVIISGGCQ